MIQLITSDSICEIKRKGQNNTDDHEDNKVILIYL